MDLEKGGGKNEDYDNAEALENYDFKHKKTSHASNAWFSGDGQSPLFLANTSNV